MTGHASAIQGAGRAARVLGHLGLVTSIKIHVVGWASCPDFQRAVDVAFALSTLGRGFHLETKDMGDREGFYTFLNDQRKFFRAMGSAAAEHCTNARTCPIIWESHLARDSFIGDDKDLVRYSQDLLKASTLRALQEVAQSIGKGSGLSPARLGLKISGFASCGYFQNTHRLSRGLQVLFPDAIEFEIIEHSQRSDYQAFLQSQRSLISGIGSHTSSPAVWTNSGFVGGNSDLVALCTKLTANQNTSGPGRLHGKAIIVTGAGGGIGKVIALQCLAEGAKVVGFDRTQSPREGGLSTLQEAQKRGFQNVSFVEGDVSNAKDIEEVVKHTVELHGRLDVIVNNAAIGVDVPLCETSEADFDRVMAVNCKGVFLGCKAAIAQMLTQKIRFGETRGRIVNISSQHGMVGAPSDFAYGTGKATVVYMTKQIATDYAKHGIVVNAVAPGKVLTGKPGAAAAPATLALAKSRTPYHRLGVPMDVAKAVVFLASEDATYISGENLMVDGGWMAA